MPSDSFSQQRDRDKEYVADRGLRSTFPILVRARQFNDNL